MRKHEASYQKREVMIPSSIEDIIVQLNTVLGDEPKEIQEFTKEEIKRRILGAQGFHAQMEKVLEYKYSRFSFWVIQTKEWENEHYMIRLHERLKFGRVPRGILLIPPTMNVEVTTILTQYSLILQHMNFQVMIKGIQGRNDKPRESLQDHWFTFWEFIKNPRIIHYETTSSERIQVSGKMIAERLKEGDVESINGILVDQGFRKKEGWFVSNRGSVFPSSKVIVAENCRGEELVPKQASWLDGWKRVPELIVCFSPRRIMVWFKGEVIAEEVIIPLKTKEKGVIDDSERFVQNILFMLGDKQVLGKESLEWCFGMRSLFFKLVLFLIQKDRQVDNELRREFEKGFHEWQKYFTKIYPRSELTEDLFIKHAYLFLLISLIHGENRIIEDSSFRYFNWIKQENIVSLLKTGIVLEKHVRVDSKKSYHVSSRVEDVFALLYQEFISPRTRHVLGEFYTPDSLAQLMVRRSYRFGERVVDPTCGSGVFLVGIIKMLLEDPFCDAEKVLQACLNVLGIDINPLAVHATRANIFLLVREVLGASEDLFSNIVLGDTLFMSQVKTKSVTGKGSAERVLQEEKVDLVIGNPPWLVLNTIEDGLLKKRLKELARELNVLPQPQQVTQLELSSLFLFVIKKYLRACRGRVVFLISKALLNGNNHSRTRVLDEFTDIEVWLFDEMIFPVQGIVLHVRYDPEEKRKSKEDLLDMRVKVKRFRGIKPEGFEVVNEDTLVPYGVFEKKNRVYMKRWISLKEREELLPLGNNPYYRKCYNGATIYPRNLVFIRVFNEGETERNGITRFKHVIERAKYPWDFDPLQRLGLEYGEVEDRFVFRVLKSSRVLPFLSLGYDQVFLPLEINKATGKYELTQDEGSFGWKYFQRLNELYKEKIRLGASLPTLWENLNYQGKLVAKRQRAPFKVVMMGSGQIVKAVLVRDENVIIDYTNFLLPFSQENEALFVLGFLNAPILTWSVRIIKADRHIQKRPFEFYLPVFDKKNANHQAIVKHVRLMEKRAKELLNEWLNKEVDWKKVIKKTLQVQNYVYKNLGWHTAKHVVIPGSDFDVLNKLVKTVLEER